MAHLRTANCSTFTTPSPTQWIADMKRPKIKTATLTLRLDPKIKAAAEAAAEKDHRSLTSLLEVLIVNHCRALGLGLEQFSKEVRQ